MIDRNTIENIIHSVSKKIPPELQFFQKELETLFRGVLQTAFSKLELVTKEELDTQVKVLQKTRKKLDELVLKVEALEKNAPR